MAKQDEHLAVIDAAVAARAEREREAQAANERSQNWASLWGRAMLRLDADALLEWGKFAGDLDGRFWMSFIKCLVARSLELQGDEANDLDRARNALALQILDAAVTSDADALRKVLSGLSDEHRLAAVISSLTFQPDFESWLEAWCLNQFMPKTPWLTRAELSKACAALPGFDKGNLSRKIASGAVIKQDHPFEPRYFQFSHSDPAVQRQILECVTAYLAGPPRKRKKIAK